MEKTVNAISRITKNKWVQGSSPSERASYLKSEKLELQALNLQELFETVFTQLAANS